MRIIIPCFFIFLVYGLTLAQTITEGEKKTDSLFVPHGKGVFKPGLEISEMGDAVHFEMERLPEVLIYKNSEINAVALGLIPREVEPLTLNEKRLRTASVFEPVFETMTLGVSLPLNPIINAISGRTKRLKKIVSVERNALNVAYLRRKFSEYIFKNFRIAEIDFGRFVYFIADNSHCTAVIETKNTDLIQLFICARWVDFSAEN